MELHTQLDLAKQKLELARDCRIVSCYEAGRDGFWIHRRLHRERERLLKERGVSPVDKA